MTAVLCWLTEGQELDEEKLLILWTCLHQNLLLKVGANSACQIGHHADSASRISCHLWDRFLHRIYCQRQPKARANPGYRISRLANSGSRIRCQPDGQILAIRIRLHPNGQILASESDGIPMGKFWLQNRTASQWANSGTRIRRHPNGQILAPKSPRTSPRTLCPRAPSPSSDLIQLTELIVLGWF